MFKLFKKKSPKVAILEDLSRISIGKGAINLGEKLSKYQLSIVLEVIHSEILNKKLIGKLVGQKGWFLPDADNLLTQCWSNLLKGAIDLSKVSKEWGGLGNKRVYLALEEFAKEKKQTEPIFSRSSDTLFLNSYLSQEFLNSINFFNFEIGVEFSKVLEYVSLPKDQKTLFENYVIKLMSEKKSEYKLGGDGMIRKITDLDFSVNEWIAELFENQKEILYDKLSQKFGVDSEMVGKIILDLISKKELQTITNYPLDEKIVKKD